MSRRRTPPTRRTAAVAAALAAATALAVVTASSSGSEALEVRYEQASGRLDFRGETFDGQPIGSDELAGTPVVLNFYASWCTICDRELPDFERVSQDLDGRVRFVGVNPQSNDTDEAQARMVERNGVTYPTLPDPSDELLRQFATSGGLPVTVFLDADGVVRKVHNGLLTEQQLRDELAALGVRA